MPRAAVCFLVALLTALALAACGKDDNGPGVPAATTLEAATSRGPFGVGVTTITVVDPSRPTQANGDYAGAPDRTLVLEVWYPADPASETPEARDAPLDREGAPYPLIVFAHGYSSGRRQSSSYTQHLASHGYVVAAPDFPLTNGGAPGGPRFIDLLNQPGDVSFIIDRFLAFNEEEGNFFEGAIDGESIGLTGHSLGGFTTLLAVYGSDREERLDAALPLSASGCFLTEDMTEGVAVPIMLLTGSEDLIVPAAGNRRAYDMANPPRYWTELVGGNHIRFADVDAEDTLAAAALERIRSSIGQSEDVGVVLSGALGDFASCAERPEPSGAPTVNLDEQQRLLRAFATPFFDAYLRGSDEAREFLQEDLPASVGDAVRFEFEGE